MGLFIDVNRLLREDSWDAESLAQEVYAILDGASLNGLNGPLKINTQGSQPGIIFSAQNLIGGVPFQLQIGGQAFNYTFGPLQGLDTSPTYQTGTSSAYGATTFGGNVYNYANQPNPADTFTFNPLDFPVPPVPPGWQGGNPGSTTNNAGGVTWPALTQTVTGGGGATAGAGYGTVAAVGQILSGGGDTYEFEVKGFGGGSFRATATGLGLAASDKLDAGTWHTLVAYVSPDGSAQVWFTPPVFNRGV